MFLNVTTPKFENFFKLTSDEKSLTKKNLYNVTIELQGQNAKFSKH